MGTVYTYVLTLLTFLSPCLKPMYGVRDPVSMHCRQGSSKPESGIPEGSQARHRVNCAQPPTGRGAALPAQHRAEIRGSPQQHQGSALLRHWPEPKSAPGLLTLASMSHLLPSEHPPRVLMLSLPLPGRPVSWAPWRLKHSPTRLPSFLLFSSHSPITPSSYQLP